MDEYYVVFIPKRSLEYSDFNELIFKTKDSCLSYITDHYIKLYKDEMDYCARWDDEKWNEYMNGDSTLTTETRTKYNYWLEKNPKTLVELLEFYRDMHEEPDFWSNWGLGYNEEINEVEDMYEIVKCEVMN